ncbi:TSPAN8 [Bugula neritina]|uniref:TSPAN8 n=1 Tax=Bugula neritina TaxID=10212 RepID=A0A7J7IWI4_BUGNE|nr:TSPAN8 [Bugula neritina]
MGSGSGLSGCFACIKYLMFAFNFIFWLIGCALVGFGIWVLVDDTFKELAADTSFAALQYAGIGIIVVGCVIMIIGFFGCCGAIREILLNDCYIVIAFHLKLNTYYCIIILYYYIYFYFQFFVCMFILFAGLIAVGTLCFIRKDEVSMCKCKLHIRLSCR